MIFCGIRKLVERMGRRRKWVTKQAIDRMLKRWGNRMAISFSNGQTETCYGWIQPLNYKKMPVSDEIGVLQGGYDESYFYLRPSSCHLDQDPQGTTVLEESSGREYHGGQRILCAAAQ